MRTTKEMVLSSFGERREFVMFVRQKLAEHNMVEEQVDISWMSLFKGQLYLKKELAPGNS